MTDAGPLIVPVNVQALAVNQANIPLIRAGMHYGHLGNYQSPNPGPFQNDEGDFATDHRGVLVMWTLPRALRHGQQQADGSLQFPLVPNRWLVVRLFRAEGSGVQAPAFAAWVVQSDAIDATNGASSYIDPQNDNITPTLIGLKTEITSNPWQEPANPRRIICAPWPRATRRLRRTSPSMRMSFRFLMISRPDWDQAH